MWRKFTIIFGSGKVKAVFSFVSVPLFAHFKVQNRFQVIHPVSNHFLGSKRVLYYCTPLAERNVGARRTFYGVFHFLKSAQSRMYCQTVIILICSVILADASISNQVGEKTNVITLATLKMVKFLCQH